MSTNITENFEKSLAPVSLTLITLMVLLFGQRLRLGSRFAWGIISLAALSLLVLQVALVAWPTMGYPLEDFPSIPLALIPVALAVGLFCTWTALFLDQALGRAGGKTTTLGKAALLLLGLSILAFAAIRGIKFLGWELRQGDSLPVLDEFAAVAFGHFPLSDYAGLYQNLLGLPLLWLSNFGPLSLTGVMTYIVALQALSVIICVALLFVTIALRFVWLALLIFFGFLLLPSFLSLSIFDFWSNMPARLLIPTLLGLILVAIRALLVSQRAPRGATLSASFVGGVLAGTSAMNNLDFGIPATAIFLFLIFILAMKSKFFKCFVASLVGLGTAFLTFTLYGRVIGRPIHWELWYSFAVSYQGLQWWAVPMPVLGVHVLYLGLMLAAFSYGFLALWNKGLGASSGALLITYFAAVGTLAFVYFAGRSHLGVTVSMNLFFAVTMALWVGTVLSEVSRDYITGNRLYLTASSCLVSAVVGLGLFGFLWGVPRDIAPTRYVSPQSVDGWYAEGSIEDQGREISAALQANQIDPLRVGLLISNSALIANSSGVSRTMLVPLPFYLQDIRGLAVEQCEIWKKRNIQYVLGEKPPSCSNPVFLRELAGRPLWAISSA
jgi:hypothetical protein